jgi:hypothetical protein
LFYSGRSHKVNTRFSQICASAKNYVYHEKGAEYLQNTSKSVGERIKINQACTGNGRLSGNFAQGDIWRRRPLPCCCDFFFFFSTLSLEL